MCVYFPYLLVAMPRRIWWISSTFDWKVEMLGYWMFSFREKYRKVSWDFINFSLHGLWFHLCQTSISWYHAVSKSSKIFWYNLISRDINFNTNWTINPEVKNRLNYIMLFFVLSPFPDMFEGELVNHLLLHGEQVRILCCV